MNTQALELSQEHPIDEDIRAVREMNPHSKALGRIEPAEWPAWARHNLLLLARYRARCVSAATGARVGAGGLGVGAGHC